MGHQCPQRDMPFDQFTVEQIAGDLLPGATVEQRVATGFHRNTLANRESGIDNEQTRVEQVMDRTNTVGTVWLGLTVGCAQCHDHKYDPLKQKEYYQLFSFFNNAEEVNIDAPLPGEIGPFSLKVVEYRKNRQKLLDEYRVPELMREWEKNLLRAALHPGERLDWDNALTELKSSESQPVYNQGEKILRRIPASARTSSNGCCWITSSRITAGSSSRKKASNSASTSSVNSWTRSMHHFPR